MINGYNIVADFGKNQLLEKGTRRFAKIWLISDASNLKNWRVESATIPRRLSTFIDRPYISEPGLAHFNTDNLELEEILKKQEDYRVGNIREVVTASDGQAYAIVEFITAANSKDQKKIASASKVWNEMKQGKAVYSSPAVAGFYRLNGTEKVYYDWFGLHLARVADPAYGVHYASLKETCESTEAGICMKQMLATASASLENSSQLGEMTHYQSMSMNDESNKDSKFDIKKQEQLENEVKTLTASLNSLKEELKKKPETAAADDKDCEKDEHGKCKEDKTSSASTEKVEITRSELDNLKNMATSYANEKKQGLIDGIVDMKATVGMIDDNTEAAERETLGKQSIEQLVQTASTIEPFAKRFMEMSSASGFDGQRSTPSRLVKMPKPSSASTEDRALPKKLSDLQGGWY